MGTDCNIYLPGNVRLCDVATVIGIALGCEVHGLSHRVTFAAPFTCSLGHNGKLFFGDVTIGTGETSDEEE